MVVTVDPHGKATQVADFGGVEGKNAQQLIQYAGSVRHLRRTALPVAVSVGDRFADALAA